MNPEVEHQPSMAMPVQTTSNTTTPVVVAQLTGVSPESKPVTQPITPAVTSSTGLSGAPQVAHDDDLIEKEWVVKAKEIVSATQNDPYEQNRQMAALKADYMQKRYNKTVKLSE